MLSKATKCTSSSRRGTYHRSLGLAAEDIVVTRSAEDLDQAGEDAVAADLLVVVGADIGRRRSGGLGASVKGRGGQGGGGEGQGEGGGEELHDC